MNQWLAEHIMRRRAIDGGSAAEDYGVPAENAPPETPEGMPEVTPPKQTPPPEPPPETPGFGERLLGAVNELGKDKRQMGQVNQALYYAALGKPLPDDYFARPAHFADVEDAAKEREKDRETTLLRALLAKKTAAEQSPEQLAKDYAALSKQYPESIGRMSEEGWVGLSPEARKKMLDTASKEQMGVVSQKFREEDAIANRKLRQAQLDHKIENDEAKLKETIGLNNFNKDKKSYDTLSKAGAEASDSVNAMSQLEATAPGILSMDPKTAADLADISEVDRLVSQYAPSLLGRVEGTDTQQAISKAYFSMTAEKIHQLYGGALTVGELSRAQKLFGEGKLSDPSQQLAAIMWLKATVYNHLKNTQGPVGAYRPEALKNFAAQGMTSYLHPIFSDLNAGERAQSAEGRSMADVFKKRAKAAVVNGGTETKTPPELGAEWKKPKPGKGEEGWYRPSANGWEFIGK